MRDELLTAARAQFAERGYSGATIRTIAAAADVDPALIRHYFGDKEGLFRAALLVNFDPVELATSVASGPRATIGTRLVRQFFTMYDTAEFRTAVLALLRTAMTDPDTALMLRELIVNRAAPVLATQAVGERPQKQVILAMTTLMGVVIGRYVVGLPELTEASLDDLVADLGPVVQRYFDGTYSTSGA